MYEKQTIEILKQLYPPFVLDVCEKNYEETFIHYLNGPDTAPVVPVYTHRKLSPVFCLFAKAVYTALKNPESSVVFIDAPGDELKVFRPMVDDPWPDNLVLWGALSKEEEHSKDAFERKSRCGDFMFITDVARWKYPCNYGKSNIDQGIMKQLANSYLQADIVKDIPESDWRRLNSLNTDSLYVEWFRRRGTSTALLIKALYLALTNFGTPVIYMCPSEARLGYIKSYLKGSYPKNLQFMSMAGGKSSFRGLEKSIFVFDFELQNLIQREIKRVTSELCIEDIVKQVVF